MRLPLTFVPVALATLAAVAWAPAAARGSEPPTTLPYPVLLSLDGRTGVTAHFERASGMGQELHKARCQGAIPEGRRHRFLSLTLEIGRTRSADMRLWRKNMRDDILDRRSGTVTIFDPKTSAQLARYRFAGGWPCEWKVAAGAGDTPEMAIDKIVIAVEQVDSQ